MELPDIASSVSDSILEQICNLVAKMMNNLAVDALFVYIKIGHLASLLSRCQLDCQIFAFSSMTSVRRCLDLQWSLLLAKGCMVWWNHLSEFATKMTVDVTQVEETGWKTKLKGISPHSCRHHSTLGPPLHVSNLHHNLWHATFGPVSFFHSFLFDFKNNFPNSIF